MKPLTLTTAGQLKPGDQYMIEGRDVVYTVLAQPCAYGGMRYVTKGENRLPDMVEKRRTVIFLKHADKNKLP